MSSPMFAQYIGIDYSGASTPVKGLNGLAVYRSQGAEPVEVPPPAGKSKYWSRKGIARWLVEVLSQREPTIVGIDHGFSFPLQYFSEHSLLHDWSEFLGDFHTHWPTDQDGLRVEDIRKGLAGNGEARGGNAKWRRLCEHRTGAKSVFHFDVQGSVAKSTHAGLPWLRFIRRELGNSVHFWPFDGWEIPTGKSAIVEAYPALHSHAFPRTDRNEHQHDAYSVSRWMSETDANGNLAKYLQPELSTEYRQTAGIEGWIIGLVV